MAVTLPIGGKYYIAPMYGDFFGSASAACFLFRTPATPISLSSFNYTLIDLVVPPGGRIGNTGTLPGQVILATDYSRSAAAASNGPGGSAVTPPYSSGIWYGIVHGQPSWNIFDGRFPTANVGSVPPFGDPIIEPHGSGVDATQTSPVTLAFNTCYVLTFLLTWAASGSTMKMYLGTTADTSTEIASQSIGNLTSAGFEDMKWAPWSASIGAASDPSFPSSDCAIALSDILWLNGVSALNFVTDIRPTLHAWSSCFFSDGTWHAHFTDPSHITRSIPLVSDPAEGAITYVGLSSPASAAECFNCSGATPSPGGPGAPPPPPPVPPSTTPTHCTPETTVGNGGSGHSGCNPGGVGTVPSYFGPWGTVPSHLDPVDGESMINAEGVDVWVEIIHDEFPTEGQTIYRRSFVDLADPSTYQGGLKAGGLLGVGDVEHGLGNEQGGFEAATVEVSYADGADRLFRRLLADQELGGDEVRIKIATIAGRAAHVPPRVLARAVAQKPRLSSALDASFSASDYLFSEFGPFGPGRQFPSWLIPESIFPTAPYDSLQQTLPVIYGEKSDEGAIDPATGETHPKGLVPLIYVGQQSLATATVPPTSAVPPFSEAVVPPPSSDVVYLLFPIGTLTFLASPNHASVTNYVANLYTAGSVTPLLDTLDLGVPLTDSNDGIAVNIRAWLDGHLAGDYDVTVTAVTADDSVESGVSNSFTVPVSAESGSGSAGWSGPVNIDPQFAIVTIYQGRGSRLVLKRGPVASYDTTPHNFRVTWKEAAQASEYYVFMYTAGSGWDAYANPYAAATVRYKRVPASPTNSHDPIWDYVADFTSETDGLPWPPTEETTPTAGSLLWDCYVLAGHAIFDILSIYGSDLAAGGENTDQTRILLDPDARGDLLVPFFSRWPFPTTYRDFTAADGSVYRLTVIYATGPVSDAHKNGEISLCVNCIGVEDVGDGSGLPLTDAHAVQQHWLENFLIDNYRSGLWVIDGTHPRWEDGTAMVRSSAFAEAQAFSSRLGNRGLTVGWYAGAQRVLQDWFREWNASTDTRLGLNAHGQIVVKAFDDTVDVSVWPQVLHDTDLFGDVVQVFGEERENVVSGICDWDPDKKQFRGKNQSFSSERAITKYKNRRKEGTLIESTLLIDPSQMQWVLQRRLARLQDGAKTVEVTGKVDFLDYDVGLGIRLTTIEGTGERGYENAPMLIVRRRFNVADRLVTLTLVNFSDFVVEQSQAFFIGSDAGGSPDLLGNPIGTEGDSVLVTV